MQTATSETESKSLDLSICVHHYTLRAPCPKGQGNLRTLHTIAFFVSCADAPAFVALREAMGCWENDSPPRCMSTPRPTTM